MVKPDVALALDDCLQQVAAGRATVEECLSRYPAHAGTLRPILQAAAKLQEAGAPGPSATFKARARAQLLEHARRHPHSASALEEARVAAAPAWLLALRQLAAGLGRRPAVALSLLIAVLLLSITGVAQAALPGQPLYAWKRASESAWRAVQPDPLAVDLALSERRAEEVIGVSDNPQAEPIAQEAYVEVLRRLARYEDAQQQARIAPALARQQKELEAAGVDLTPFREWLPPSETPPDQQPAATPALPSPATPGPGATPLPTNPALLATPLPQPSLVATPLPPALETALPRPTVAPPDLPKIEATLVDDLPQAPDLSTEP